MKLQARDLRYETNNNINTLWQLKQVTIQKSSLIWSISKMEDCICHVSSELTFQDCIHPILLYVLDIYSVFSYI